MAPYRGEGGGGGVGACLPLIDRTVETGNGRQRGGKDTQDRTARRGDRVEVTCSEDYSLKHMGRVNFAPCVG